MEIIDMTAIFLSLMVLTDRNDLLSHAVQCGCLLASFIILYTITGINALKRITAPKPEAPSSSSSSLSTKTATATTKKQILNKNHAPVITPMRSTADFTTPHNNNNKQAEPIVASGSSSSSNSSKNINAATTPYVDTPLDDLSPSNKDKKEQSSQLTNTNAIIKKKDPTDTQVIPTKVDEEYVDVVVKEVVAQPTVLVKTPESSIPQEQNNENDSSASTEIADDDRSSNKNQYYEEINKKGNNIMAFSDNLQRIFNEPPTPSLDHNIRPFSSIHTSTVLIDEAITTTPALTPPNQSSATGSTLSRKSSTTSQHSTLFKSRLQMAMQKVARSSSINNDKNNNNNNNNKQQQHDVTDTTTTLSSSSEAAAAAAAAVAVASASKKKRFSSIRLTRKKSLNNLNIADNSQQESSTAAPTPTIRPKKSISTKFLKNTGKRFSKIFS